MTRRRRRATSSPQRVGSDAGLTTSRPTPPPAGDEPAPSEPGAARREVEQTKVEQTKDDTDDGWGERGDDDATGRWLRENRPPHWS